MRCDDKRVHYKEKKRNKEKKKTNSIFEKEDV